VSAAPAAPSRSWSGLALALVAAVGFSAKAVLVKLAYREGVDTTTLLALRMGLSLPFFLAATWWASHREGPGGPARRNGRDLAAVVFLGLLGYYLSSLLDFLGLRSVSAGLERLILFLYPTVTLFLTAALAARMPLRREMLAAALGYGGLLVVFVHDLGQGHADTTAGALFVLGGMLCYSLYLVGAERSIARMGSLRFTAGAMLVASAASLAQFALTRPWQLLAASPRALALALAMALFSTVLPVFALSAAMRRIGAARTAQLGSVGPVSTIALAAVFLDEPVTLLQLSGSACVLAGVLIAGSAAAHRPVATGRPQSAC
jgi:drug/metabolite transporter (DMT)-like permease